MLAEEGLIFRGYWASLASCGTSQQVPTVRSVGFLQEHFTQRAHANCNKDRCMRTQAARKRRLVLQCRQRRPAGLGKAAMRSSTAQCKCARLWRPTLVAYIVTTCVVLNFTANLEIQNTANIEILNTHVGCLVRCTETCKHLGAYDCASVRCTCQLAVRFELASCSCLSLLSLLSLLFSNIGLTRCHMRACIVPC